jgi:hypothetical protein
MPRLSRLFVFGLLLTVAAAQSYANLTVKVQPLQGNCADQYDSWTTHFKVQAGGLTPNTNYAICGTFQVNGSGSACNVGTFNVTSNSSGNIPLTEFFTWNQNAAAIGGDGGYTMEMSNGANTAQTAITRQSVELAGCGDPAHYVAQHFDETVTLVIAGTPKVTQVAVNTTGSCDGLTLEIGGVVHALTALSGGFGMSEVGHDHAGQTAVVKRNGAVVAQGTITYETVTGGNPEFGYTSYQLAQLSLGVTCAPTPTPTPTLTPTPAPTPPTSPTPTPAPLPTIPPNPSGTPPPQPSPPTPNGPVGDVRVVNPQDIYGPIVGDGNIVDEGDPGDPGALDLGEAVDYGPAGGLNKGRVQDGIGQVEGMRGVMEGKLGESQALHLPSVGSAQLKWDFSLTGGTTTSGRTGLAKLPTIPMHFDLEPYAGPIGLLRAILLLMLLIQFWFAVARVIRQGIA